MSVVQESAGGCVEVRAPASVDVGLRQLKGRAGLLARRDSTAIREVGGIRSGDTVLRSDRSARDHTHRALQDCRDKTVHESGCAQDRIRDVGKGSDHASIALAVRRSARPDRGSAATRSGDGYYLSRTRRSSSSARTGRRTSVCFRWAFVPDPSRLDSISFDWSAWPRASRPPAIGSGSFPLGA